jgi:hypothetical protein
MLPQQANNLAKELRLYLDYALIPGDLAPAIVWLASRTTVELRLLAELHDVECELSTSCSRVSLMKSILQYYCGAQD